MPGPVLLVSASMGAGHDAAARQLALRLSELGVDTQTVDLLALLPAGVGAGLRRFYAGMVAHAPWAYDLIYQVFFVPRAGVSASVSPMTMLAARALAGEVARVRPRLVLSTFHLAGQAAGLLRGRGRLAVPAVTYVTDAAAHLLWVSPGADLHLCATGAAAEQVRRQGGRAVGPCPAVDRRFLEPDLPVRRQPARAALGLGADEPVVLVSGGSWGAGEVEAAAHLVLAGGLVPLVLCGRSQRLAERLTAAGVRALGWRDDVPDLMSAADVLLDNAAGATAFEALAAGLPVVCARPLAGHGRDGCRRLGDEGLATWAGSDAEAVAALRRLSADGGEQVARGLALTRHDPVAALLPLLDGPPGAHA